MKLKSLQVLRGVAATLVLLYHITKHYEVKGQEFLGNIFNFGYSGVDVFFVLSGFIIIYSSAKYLSKEYTWQEFLKRRVFRIFPSYWVFLLFPILAIILVKPDIFPAQVDLTLANLSKMTFLTLGHPRLVQITWTISFEMYFYLFFTLFLINRKFIYGIAVVLILSLLNFFIDPLFGGKFFNKFYLSPLNIEFAFGLLAYYIIKTKTVSKQAAWTIVCVGIGLFLFTGLYLENLHTDLIDHDVVRVKRMLFYGVPSFVIVVGLVMLDKLRKTEANYGWLEQVGDASYVLYLIHSPLISIYDNALVLNNKMVLINQTFTSIVGAIAIIILSVLLHKWIEKPMIKFLNQLKFKK